MADTKLVIMVTHNEEIAKRFADRVIILRDGYIASDNRVVNEPDPRSELQIKKTRMSYPTALKLSATNILTKKWRTALTVLASSIGIVGIFLVLSLSSGFGRQLAGFESQTLSTFPIMVSQTTVDIDSRNFRRFVRNEPSDAEELFIYPYDTSDEVLIHNNNLSDEYLEYVESINPKLLSGIHIYSTRQHESCCWIRRWQRRLIRLMLTSPPILRISIQKVQVIWRAILIWLQAPSRKNLQIS